MEQKADGKLVELHAKTEELERVIDLVASFLLENGFDQKSIAQTSIAAEEIFINICRYANLSEAETVKISVCMEGEARAVIRFADRGAAFDPLAEKTPDTMLPLEARREGGLGIYMMQKLVSDAEYRYENGMNILTIIKRKPMEAD